jgi:hypothetical protein
LTTDCCCAAAIGLAWCQRSAGANIISLDQHSTEQTGGMFMQRKIFHLPGLAAARDALAGDFATQVAKRSKWISGSPVFGFGNVDGPVNSSFGIVSAAPAELLTALSVAPAATRKLTARPEPATRNGPPVVSATGGLRSGVTELGQARPVGHVRPIAGNPPCLRAPLSKIHTDS